MSDQAHWNNIYRTKQRTEVSWYAPRLTRSLSCIAAAAPNKDAEIIDIGAGQSTLADDLLERGYHNLNLLDISDAALSQTRERLDARGAKIQWYVGDVTSVALPANRFEVWHDRAVFHFLLEPAQRAAYVAQVRHSVKQGGQVVIATFAPDGPLKCSGLPVARYDAPGLSAELGEGFELIDYAEEAHHTPAGAVQNFIYCRLRRT